jgi:hypothetical protein
MKYGDWEIEYSPYIYNSVVPDEGQSKEEALAEVLPYHAGAILKQHQPKVRTAVTISRFLSGPASEMAVVIDPDAKKLFFGTETEAQTRLDAN